MTNDLLTMKFGNKVKDESDDLLGFSVSNNLKWENHISKHVRKLHFKLFTLRQIKEKLSKSLLKRVCDAIFISRLKSPLNHHMTLLQAGCNLKSGHHLGPHR